ncbi:MAG: MBOAT family O-acyltransferase [Alphaproteobacteria bacterium]|nr:MBOAT family O-acyltransferase [Alphaproteobacteria bacterium]
MVFSSVVFLFLFLPLVLGIYVLLPSLRLRNWFLILASLLFYAWGELGYVLILLASIGMNYLFGLLAARTRHGQAGRWVVGAAVAANLALLGTFKYLNFLVDNLNAAAGRTLLELDPVHLPLGISFFTFQALTYVIDIHRGDAPVQRRIDHVALYISMFPQLVAGPIVRYSSIARRLVDRTVTRDDFSAGVQRFVIGLGKKVLIADTLAGPADAVFALPPDQLTTPVAWLGLACYTLQLYFDFSGYSDMAIGLGRMFGFRFPENFRYPYISRSVREFWRRWHISLSTWFRDYVYLPMGGGRVGHIRVFGNLLTVFVLCGLWHGASWNFVIWGLHHGLFLGLERTRFGDWLAVQPGPLRHGYALAVVMLGWVWFRADTLPAALGYFQALSGASAGAVQPLFLSITFPPEVIAALLAGAVGSMPVFRILKKRYLTAERPVAGGRAALMIHGRYGAALVWTLLVLTASAATVAATTHSPFLYFRF